MDLVCQDSTETLTWTADTCSTVDYTNLMNTYEELRAVYELPWTELVYRAASVHRQYHDPQRLLLSLHELRLDFGM